MKNIFVSSTFRDMHEERDILHERVMPELNEYAAGYGESVSFCDLRWGVNTEDLESEEGSRKVLSVCLDEIDRCRPYMLVILGERYGWIPEPETMLAAEEGRGELDPDDLEKSVTALEIEYGALRCKGQLSRTLFYFREFEGSAPEGYGQEDALHAEKLSELKARIRKLAGENLHTYTVSWDRENHVLRGIERFAEQVTEDVKRLMEEDWKEYAGLSPYEKDRRFQWDYARQKGEQFRAREDLVEEYIEKLNHGQKLLALTGPAGSGKSTLMARLAVKLQEKGREVLPVFCGSTMLCNDAPDVLRYIVRYIEDQLSLEHFEDVRENKTDDDGWTERLSEMCVQYTNVSDRELVILIDAVDQLYADELRDSLRFIPANLSDKVKVVCSFLDTFHPGYHRELRETETIRPLEKQDKTAVMKGILAAAKRELADSVTERIAGKKGSDNPLYLSLAVQRLIMMDRSDFEQIVEQGDGISAITEHQLEIVDGLPDDLAVLCMDIVHAASAKLGGELSELAVQYIAASRYGLREKDLEGIFAVRGMKWSSLDFTLFIRYLKSFFLFRDDGRWDFTHQSIRKGFREQCGDERKLHGEILEHLKKLDKRDEVRKEEIIYHCCKADDRRYFVDYINRNRYEEEVALPAAKTLYETAMQDGGDWLCGTINSGEEYDAGHNFIAFLHFELSENFGSSKKELEILDKIFSAVLYLLHLQNQKKENMLSLCDLSISYQKLGEVYEGRDGHDNLEKAGKLYGESLEIFEKLLENQAAWPDLHNLSVCYQRLAGIYVKQGGRENLKKAGELYKKSLEIAEKLSDDPGTRECQTNLGTVCENLGRLYERLGGRENLEKAEKLYRQGLEIWEKVTGEQGTREEFRGLCITCGELGEVYERLGGWENLEKAEEQYRRSLEIAEKLAEEKKTEKSIYDLITFCARLGGVYESRGGREDLEKAGELYRRCLKTAERFAEEQGSARSLRHLLISHESLGRVYESLGGRENLKKAAEQYRQSLQTAEIMAEELKTEESLKTLSTSYEKLGRLYEILGGRENLEKAECLLRRSLEIRQRLTEEKWTRENFRILGISCEQLAGIYEAWGDRENLEKAEKLYRKSLEIRQRLSEEQGTGENLRDLSVSCIRLGGLYEKQEGHENLKKAESLYRRGLEINERLAEELGTGENLRDLGVSCIRLGGLYEKQEGHENLKKAESLYRRGLEINERLAEELGTGENLRDLSVSCSKLGKIYEKQGGKENLEKAEELYRKSLGIKIRLLKEQGTGEDLRDLSVGYERLGEVYERLGDRENLEKAEKMYEKSLEIRKELAKELRTIASYDDLAVGLYKVAAHPYTDPGKRKEYLAQMIAVSVSLYQQTRRPRYQQFIETAGSLLRET